MTPPLNEYNLAMEFADDWGTFEALVEHSYESEPEEEYSLSKEAYGGLEPKEDHGWSVLKEVV